MQIGRFIVYTGIRHALAYPRTQNGVKTSLKQHTVSQSFCTNYTNLSGQLDIFLGPGTLKKSGPKYGPEKSRVQKRVIVIQHL